AGLSLGASAHVCPLVCEADHSTLTGRAVFSARAHYSARVVSTPTAEARSMRRTTAAVVTALVFLAAILAWASYQAGGNPFTYPGFAWMVEHNFAPSVIFVALSLGYVVLAAWIAAALARGQARAAIAVGWIAALPTLIGVCAALADATG